MRLTEFRIPMPLSMAEYRLGLLYASVKSSLCVTGGGEGVEWISNKECTKGRYTLKNYHIKSKVPGFVRALLPNDVKYILREESWNTFPSGYTFIDNPWHMKNGKFYIEIRTIVLPGHGKPEENLFKLSREDLDEREIEDIDIATDDVPEENEKPGEDPAEFRSDEKMPRGPLRDEGWVTKIKPIITVYKLVRCNFKWWGLQGKAEKRIMDTEKKFFTIFHRNIWVWFNEWRKMSMKSVRNMEDEAMNELDRRRRNESQLRGISEL